MAPPSDGPSSDGSPADGPSSDGPPTDGSSPGGTLFDRTLEYVDRLRLLALVPLATALLGVDDVTATAGTDELISVTASFPIYRYDLWSMVDAPGGGAAASVPFDGVGSPALTVPLLAAYVVVSGALSAGYFGSIAAAITTGRFDFAANVRRFAVRMIALEALVVAAVLVAVLPAVAFPPLLLFGVVVALVGSYLFFPTVYVLTLDDCGIEPAFRRAYGLVARHRPLRFFVVIVAATALCSVPLSALAYAGPVSAVVAAAVAAPVGLAFNVATALKVAAMADVDAVR